MPYRHGHIDTSLPDGMRSYAVSDRSDIPWCDATIRPILGCTRMDAETGCHNCCACRLAATLLRHLPQYAGLTNTRVGHAGERAEHNWTGAIRGRW